MDYLFKEKVIRDKNYDSAYDKLKDNSLLDEPEAFKMYYTLAYALEKDIFASKRLTKINEINNDMTEIMLNKNEKMTSYGSWLIIVHQIQ